MLTAEKFETMIAEFNCGFDPRNKMNFRKNWRKSDFKEYQSDDDSLFKLCAKQMIDESSDH